MAEGRSNIWNEAAKHPGAVHAAVSRRVKLHPRLQASRQELVLNGDSP